MPCLDLRRESGTGTLDAESARMAKIQRVSEAWTVPLHVVMWATLTVGFIMVVVVLMLH